MKLSRLLCLAGLLACGILNATTARAAEPRQRYGPWQFSQAKGYFFRSYEVKPTPDSDYKKHVVILSPNQPGFYYYYNVEAKKFWGRAPVFNCHGLYSMLAPVDQKGSLADIPDSAFPQPTTPPTVPQTELEKVKDPKAPQLQLPDGPPPAFAPQG